MANRVAGLPVCAWICSGLTLLSCGCTRTSFSCGDGASERPPGAGLPASADVRLPESTDWTDVGAVIDTGEFGSWDTVMEGITPAAVLRRGGVYMLYYVGAADYIADPRNIGPAHRSVGVAVSPDGINWTKASSNPVLTFSSSGSPEEGAVSAAVVPTPDGTLLAYYGANTASARTSALVNADGRLATSLDGLSFAAAAGTVIDHRERSVWGFGDEIHPTLALEEGGTYYVYYVPNGTPEAGRLGVCHGGTPSSLTTCEPVKGRSGAVTSRGPSSAVRIAPNTLAMFVNNRGGVNVHLVDTNDLTCFGAPVRTYPFQESTLFVLDRARRTWFAYYNKWTHIGLRIAPAGERDATPPAAPLGLRGSSQTYDQVNLTWTGASDPDTGILGFDVFRDGMKVGATRTGSFTDTGLRERTSYEYEIRAVNLHGVQGSGAVQTVRTVDDNVPPTIEAVSAVAPDRVVITFSEPISRVTAQSSSHYSLGSGVRVTNASVTGNPRVVTLTTSPMIADAVYTLAIAQIGDMALKRNHGTDTRQFTASSIPGLVAHWRLDRPETAAVDGSGHAHDATTVGSPAAERGRALGAIRLTGQQYLEVPPSPGLADLAFGSFTITAWARPSDAPPRTMTTNAAYALFSGPGRLELRYGFDQRYVAAIATSIEHVTVSSQAFAPDVWHHVAMAVDAARRTVALFVDGNPVSGSPRAYSGDRARTRLGSPNHDRYHSRYRIGVTNPRFSDNSNYFSGALDDVRVYDRALTQAEVQSIHQAVQDFESGRN